jgi:hypothetical protein
MPNISSEFLFTLYYQFLGGGTPPQQPGLRKNPHFENDNPPLKLTAMLQVRGFITLGPVGLMTSHISGDSLWTVAKLSSSLQFQLELN